MQFLSHLQVIEPKMTPSIPSIGEKREGDSIEAPDIKKHQLQATKVDHFEKGLAPIKPEFIIDHKATVAAYNDDEAEDSKSGDTGNQSKRGKKNRGQNKKRELKQVKDEVRLCPSLINPDNQRECSQGEKCTNVHDIDVYIASKPADIEGVCPVYTAIGYCPSGYKCRWLSFHFDKESKKILKDTVLYEESKKDNYEINYLPVPSKHALQKKKYEFKTVHEVTKYLDKVRNVTFTLNGGKDEDGKDPKLPDQETEQAKLSDNKKDIMASYIDPPFKIAEKKKLDLRGAKIVSPLTTVGNLPYRRLMKTLGADVTYSEMALCSPLIQGYNAEWALPKAHSSEYPGFGVQIATNQYDHSTRVAEIISRELGQVSELNLNCGCPIDLLYRQGQGSALMEQAPKLLRVLKGMNACSGDIPVTLKIRTGTKDNKNIAKSLVEKVLAEGDTAAITLHGRSRQQRYTKEADWNYIGEVGKVVQQWNEKKEEDKERSDVQRTNFVGNGDVFTYEDWYKGVGLEGVDSVMVARGALIKPWIFEEVESQQYLDKSATERLEYLRQYANFALEHWGSDEYGIQSARRYMLEFMSFTHRYIPVGILDRLPPKLNERPPQWRGRNELETLLGSTNYQDWIKVTEMFLGKVSDKFQFTPKHKSNSH